MRVFCVQFTFDKNLDKSIRNALLSKWLEEAMENNDLQFGGGGISNSWEGVAEHSEGQEVTEGQRIQVEEWLRNNPLIHQFKVGPLVESTQLWHTNTLVLD